MSDKGKKERNNMKDIKTDEIYKQINEQKEKRKCEDAPIAFEDVYIADTASDDSPNTLSLFSQLDGNGVMDIYNIPLSNNKIKAFFQKIMRKITAFLLLPITENQARYNEANTKLVKRAYGFDQSDDTQAKEIIDQLGRSEKLIDDLESRVIYLEAELEKLKKQEK